MHPLVVAIFATLVLGAGKLAVALATGSAAVLASAADSLGDAVVSGVNLVMLRQAARPADDGHPWGHGKAEALASLSQAVLLAGVVVGVVWTAGARLTGASPAPTPDTSTALWGMAASMVGSFLISTFLERAAKRTGSLVLRADAAHYRMDLLTGAAVLLGLGATALWQAPRADALAALGVSVLMVREVFRLGSEAVDELMDRPLPPDEVAVVEAALRRIGGHVRSWHDLRTRRAGPFRFIQVHVSLPPDLTFAEAHAESHRVERELAQVLANVDVIAHADLDGVDEGGLT